MLNFTYWVHYYKSLETTALELGVSLGFSVRQWHGIKKDPTFCYQQERPGELNPDQDGKEQSDLCGSLRQKANRKRGWGGGGGGVDKWRQKSQRELAGLLVIWRDKNGSKVFSPDARNNHSDIKKGSTGELITWSYELETKGLIWTH